MSRFGVFHDVPVVLTEQEYEVAMMHVEKVRCATTINNALGATFCVPHSRWKLSDTLEEALIRGASRQQESLACAIREGLLQLQGEIGFYDTCRDADADDVFN